jgi:hypothetical protein
LRYKRDVNALRLIIAGAALAAAVPAVADAGDFMLVNVTGEALSGLSIRPSAGGPWKPLGSGSVGTGRRQAVGFSGESCAYDIRAALPGGTEVIWANVNLCDTKIVSLNRRPDGTHWADYD